MLLREPQEPAAFPAPAPARASGWSLSAARGSGRPGLSLIAGTGFWKGEGEPTAAQSKAGACFCGFSSFLTCLKPPVPESFFFPPSKSRSFCLSHRESTENDLLTVGLGDLLS